MAPTNLMLLILDKLRNVNLVGGEQAFLCLSELKKKGLKV